MTRYKYDVVYSAKFKKGLKKATKQGKNIEKLLDIVDRLANKEELEPKYKNHNLRNDRSYKDCKECHIEPDWLLIYCYNNDELILLLLNIGSHADLFNM